MDRACELLVARIEEAVWWRYGKPIDAPGVQTSRDERGRWFALATLDYGHTVVIEDEAPVYVSLESALEGLLDHVRNVP